MAVAAGLTLVTVDVGAAPGADEPERYVGAVEVVRGPVGARAAAESGPDVVRGLVFDDEDLDSRHDPREEGVAGVAVSNGREVVTTGDDGSYELPAYDGMTVFVTRPEGFDVPVDEHNFPQFFYHHLPEGSPDLRFGGLPPTGPLPRSINFPVSPSGPEDSFHCAVVGDPQSYSNRELGYVRDSVVADLAARDDLGTCGAVIAGDLVGDDLGLYPRFKEVMSLAGIPIWGVPGNHDLDFDATTDEHSFDTYKREIGPAYYSFDVGDAHFVALDNVRYPCTPEDNADGKHAWCDDPENHPAYNGVIGEEQLSWLANDLAQVPEDELVVIATHIPLVSFVDMASSQHQTDDVEALYALLEGRPALSLAGHAQLVENLEAGDSFGPWQEAVGVDVIPFPHITVGAASGSWWTGDLSTEGIPESLQRGGGPPGYIDLQIDGGTFVDTYRATVGADEDQQMWLSINSPRYRDWFTQMAAWKTANPAGSPDRPPANINDLGDPNLLDRADLVADGGSALVANVWNGSTDTDVRVAIDGGDWRAATRTQEARGEDMRQGAEFADPFSTMRQLQVGRYSLESTSGDERSQGWEAYRGSRFGPGPTQPIAQGLWADQSSHLWRLPIPADLAAGPHSATVQVTDQHGRTYERSLHFEVAEERPPMPFRTELFEPPAAG